MMPEQEPKRKPVFWGTAAGAGPDRSNYNQTDHSDDTDRFAWRTGVSSAVHITRKCFGVCVERPSLPAHPKSLCWPWRWESRMSSSRSA